MAFQAVPKCIPSMLVAELEGQSPRALPLFATHPRHPAKQNRAADSIHRAVSKNPCSLSAHDGSPWRALTSFPMSPASAHRWSPLPQAMIDLISLDRAARPWTQDSVDRPIIVPLLCQGSLHLHGHVARRSVAVTEDRAVVNIVAVIGIISVGGIPPAAIPIPVTATVTDEAVIAAPPPIAVVTLPPIPALRRTIRPLIPATLKLLIRFFVPLRIVVGDNVRSVWISWCAGCFAGCNWCSRRRSTVPSCSCNSGWSPADCCLAAR